MSEKQSRSVGRLPNYGFEVFFTTDDGKPRRYIEENEVATVPNHEAGNRIYKLLEDNCDLKFCVDETSEDFKFITLEYFVIFAIDSHGNCYGTIGGCGDINDKEYPVGYVTYDGRCGKIASCFKEFLELVNYYPYWREVIERERANTYYSPEEFENKYKMREKTYTKNQLEISKTLNLKENDKSLELMMSHLTSEDEFIVFSNRLEKLI